MGKKNIVYIIIFFLVVIFLYYKYLKDEKKVKIESEDLETITYSSNIINNVYYL